MTLRQRIRFYQQLAVLARAGVPLRGSLQRLKERMATKEVSILSQQINAGERISEAFASAGFSAFECHLVTAGERSAKLDEIFEHLSAYWSRQLEMRQAIISTLYYPIVVLHLAVAVGALVELTTLPAPVAIGHLIERLMILYAVAAVIYLVVRASWSSEVAQRFWLFVPLIGGALSTAYAYRWITALKMEFSAGIPISKGVADAWRASGYVGREQLAREGEQAILNGEQLSELVQRWKRLPRDWVDFIETGEISGALETAFKNLESEAARTWSNAQQRLTEWLPKILYFVVLLITAVQVGKVMYQVEIAPIVNAQNEIDNAVNGK